MSQHPGELEVLISPGNKFRMIKNKIKKLKSIPYPENASYKTYACQETKRNVRFTLMESI